jgi:hypothetical protein
VNVSEYGNGGEANLTLQANCVLLLLMALALNRTLLEKHIHTLSVQIGGRLASSGLETAGAYIENELRSYGYTPQGQTFNIGGHTFSNIEAEINGTTHPAAILVFGAHYGTAGDLPGANDNASGVASVLELARTFARCKPEKTVRWVFFTNEEPPYFQSPAMGSYVYAKRCHERHENIDAMVSVETIGYYTDKPDSQTYPIGFHPGYPDRGNFLGFVADLKSALLLWSALKAFRSSTTLPAQGVVAPSSLPGIGWSDHWSFWQFGYKALMLTIRRLIDIRTITQRRILQTSWIGRGLGRRLAEYKVWSGTWRASNGRRNPSLRRPVERRLAAMSPFETRSAQFPRLPLRSPHSPSASARMRWRVRYNSGLSH